MGGKTETDTKKQKEDNPKSEGRKQPEKKRDKKNRQEKAKGKNGQQKRKGRGNRRGGKTGTRDRIVFTATPKTKG